MTEPYLQRDGILKLVPKWGKSINLRGGGGDYVEKEVYFGGINKLHLTFSDLSFNFYDLQRLSVVTASTCMRH
jgi:hypothetical protein